MFEINANHLYQDQLLDIRFLGKKTTLALKNPTKADMSSNEPTYRSIAFAAID